MSSGALGREILEEIVTRHHSKLEKVYFLSPKIAFPMNFNPSVVEFIVTNSVDDLYNNLQNILTTKKIDAVIHSMAVSDYTVDYVASLESMVEEIIDFQSREDDKMTDISAIVEHLRKGDFKIDTNSKMSSKSENPIIKLTPTVKVIGNIKKWSPNTILMGFKLLENVSNEELVSVSLAQMEKNKCDFVWANDIKRIRESGHQGLLISKDTVTEVIGKKEIAITIADTIIESVRQ
ncbi:phosphopantothenate--cysteine ligase [compost metagenome]